MLINFPLFLISFALYNMIAFLTPGVSWSDHLLLVPMPSGATWVITFGDVLVGLSLLFLLYGVLRTVHTASRALVDHLLAGIIVLGALAEFLLVREAATSIFAILLLIAFVELLGGWVASNRAARRELKLEQVPDSRI